MRRSICLCVCNCLLPCVVTAGHGAVTVCYCLLQEGMELGLLASLARGEGKESGKEALDEALKEVRACIGYYSRASLIWLA